MKPVNLKPPVTAPIPGAGREREGAIRRNLPVAMLGKSAALTALTMAGLGMAGCINVTAPDKPIVIELNINIKQEVVYRLASDAAATIEKNKDVF